MSRRDANEKVYCNKRINYLVDLNTLFRDNMHCASIIDFEKVT